MEKVFLQSEVEWQEYCKQHCIGYISRTYGSQCCNIENGQESKFGFKFFDEYVHVPQNPTHYPCIFVWYDDFDDVQRGMFVYQDEFNL